MLLLDGLRVDSFPGRASAGRTCRQGVTGWHRRGRAYRNSARGLPAGHPLPADQLSDHPRDDERHASG